MKNERLHNSFVMYTNVPPGMYPPDPKHGEVTYVMLRNWCECDRLHDHATAIDLSDTNRPRATKGDSHGA